MHLHRNNIHQKFLTNSPYTHTYRIAAFEESLKDWNLREVISDEPCEEVPDWMDDVENMGPRVVKSVSKAEVKEGLMQKVPRNAKSEKEVQKREVDFRMQEPLKV